MTFRFAACVCLVFAAAACSQLPAAGPSTSTILDEPPRSGATLSYALVPVDETVLATLSTRARPSLAGSFGGAMGGTGERIGVGDEIVVTIWEAANGGLFSTSSGTVGGGSKSTTIPAQPVTSGGTITIPYAGEIEAAGRTPTEVKAAIEAALAGKAIEPQALVNVKTSMTNKVTVTGDVIRGELVPLSPRGTRVLEAVAAAGGVGAPTEEVVVELARAGRTARVPLTKIISQPEENVFLRADDVLALLRQPLTFTAFGATGENRPVTFPVTGITLDEAIARVGGLLDFRADPAGVFVFRYEDPAIVRALRPDAADAAETAGVPVVYRVDLRDPKGLFRSQRFEVMDGDLVYVANANLNELQKFVALIGTAAQPPLTVRRTATAF